MTVQIRPRPQFPKREADTYAKYCRRCSLFSLRPAPFSHWLAFELQMEAQRRPGIQPKFELEQLKQIYLCPTTSPSA